MALFVDTSVWSLAFRRDEIPEAPEINALRQALSSGAQVVTTGLIIQEVLQGFAGPKQRDAIIDRLSSLPILVPDFLDYVNAAELGNICRRAGVQLKTVDALITQLCIRCGMTLLATDKDFFHAARHVPLKLHLS